MADELGMVKLGNLSADGTEIEANASRHKAMCSGDMVQELAKLQRKLEQLLSQADRVDVEQDAALGSRRGAELPEKLQHREAAGEARRGRGILTRSKKRGRLKPAAGYRCPMPHDPARRIFA